MQFLSRPFVPGDSIQLQGPSNLSVAGTVEKVAPMRTMLRTDDDTLVSIPNKVTCEAWILSCVIGGMKKGVLNRPLTGRISRDVSPNICA
jgi:small-conductance mechanosensitive channel